MFLFSKLSSFEKIIAVLHKLSIEETSLASKNFSNILLSMSLSLSVKVIDVEFLKLDGLSSWSAFTSWVSDVSLILVLSVSQSLWT